MLILSVDPGEYSGWCLFENGILKSHSIACGLQSNIHTIFNLFSCLNPNILVIESQFLSGRMTGAQKIIESRSTWQCVARLHYVDIVNANPSTWHSHFKLKHGTSKLSKYRRKKLFKKKVVQLANELAGKLLVEDECDAFLIGKWFLENDKRD